MIVAVFSVDCYYCVHLFCCKKFKLYSLNRFSNFPKNIIQLLLFCFGDPLNMLSEIKIFELF